MGKVIVSHNYDLTESEKAAAVKTNYRIIAELIIFQWAKALWYWRRKKATGISVHSYFVGEDYEDLENFPNTPICSACEEITGTCCWEVYKKFELRKAQGIKQVQNRHKVF